MMQKLIPLLLTIPLLQSNAIAGPRTYQPGYSSEEKCYRTEYHSVPHKHSKVDDNSCIEGSILGGIAGGGAGAALSRGDGRIWAIPLGIVSGALVGCQVDGG